MTAFTTQFGSSVPALKGRDTVESSTELQWHLDAGRTVGFCDFVVGLSRNERIAALAEPHGSIRAGERNSCVCDRETWHRDLLIPRREGIREACA